MSAPASRTGRPFLVGVDFSEDSRHALVWAARQAALEEASLVVLHVVHDPAASPGFYQEPDDARLRPMVDVAKDKMDTFLAEVKDANPDLPALASAKVQFVSGLPAGRIIEVADEIGAGLIVVGSRGLTGLDSILVGSVAERVVQISRIPVTVVKSPPREADS